MTYEPNGWNYKPSYLSQDDVDGVVYLYPNDDKELGGLLASCSSYAADGNSPKSGMGLELIIGFFGLMLIWRIVKRFSKST